jgi:AraC-like DNA-binding protein
MLPTAASFRIHRSLLPGIEAVEATSALAFARHTHDKFGLGVICRGAQRSRSGRGLVEASSGDTITCNPGEVHDGAPIGDAGRSWKMLYIEPAELARVLGGVRGAAVEFTQPVLRDKRLGRLVAQLFEALTAPTAMPEAADELLLTMLHALQPAMSLASIESSAPSVDLARQRLDDDPVSPAPLAHLASLCGLSRFQLVRAFARATGLTPHAYQMQGRLALARRLIGRGGQLADVAAASGFADQSHLSRIFTRSYGLPPGAYALAYARGVARAVQPFR